MLSRGGRTRTCNPRFWRPVRYQLRHAPGLRSASVPGQRSRRYRIYGQGGKVLRVKKTTVEIPEELLIEAKELAAREQTTLRELVERGLRMVVRRRGRAEPFRLRDASVHGDGLTPEFQDAGWDEIRDALYERDDS